MLELKKTNTDTLDFGAAKLIIKVPKEALNTPILKPKKVSTLKQNLQPEEAQNSEVLFKIY